MRFTLKNKLHTIIKIFPLLLLITLVSGCFGNKASKQLFVNDYFGIIKEMKSRNEVMKLRGESIIAYRKSGFMDVDNAEAAKMLSLEIIRLDSITLEHIKSIKMPDKVSAEIIISLGEGIMSSIQGNSLFEINYGKAKDQNIEERKGTILNVRPGMKHLAEGLNSIVKSIEKLQVYIRDNNLDGGEEVEGALLRVKMERDKLAGFL